MNNMNVSLQFRVGLWVSFDLWTLSEVVVRKTSVISFPGNEGILTTLPVSQCASESPHVSNHIGC